MLEHMLFKPTQTDLQNKVNSGAMQFERETGCILNANTWKDRTTYFFSYPKEYLFRALQIESERMHGVVISDKEFLPERNNVLSEFDMYFGDPYFALSVDMVCSAFYNSPYGHETIGFREDIERYTTPMLKDFYERYYDPANATLTIVGDIDEVTALEGAVATFGPLQTKGLIKRNVTAVEPKQEGLRRVSIERNSSTNIVSFGVRHNGFPTKEWFEVQLLASILTEGPESLLYTKLVDAGLASRVEMSVEPTRENNLGVLNITLTKKTSHSESEALVFDTIAQLNPKDIASLYKKVQARIITGEIFGRESSLAITRELTEYVSAGVWEEYFNTEKILQSISAKDIVNRAKTLFVKNHMVIGHFIGTSSKM
jgi:zinc protease